MKRIFQTPETAFPLALSLVLLALVGVQSTLAPASIARQEGGAWLLVAFGIAGAVMAMFRPFRGLSLGGAVLAPTAFFYGPIIAGALAGLLRLVQLLGRPPVERRKVRAWLGAGPLLAGSLAGALAGLAAAAVWFPAVVSPESEAPAAAMVVWAGLAGLLQAAMLLGLGWIREWSGGVSESDARLLDYRWLLEPAGWLLGGMLVAVFASAGAGVGLAALVVLVALVIELTRNELLIERRGRQIETLSEMSGVGLRMGTAVPELARVAEQLLGECRKLVPAQWMQLELTGTSDEETSWWLDPAGGVEPGKPEPPEAPPSIPGVHRRVTWQVLEKDLVSGEKKIATLRLWTDPRQVEWEELELLDTLLPQLATSLATVLLDFKAHRDALTGSATRSVLEDRLQRAYERCCLEGQAMSVVMCDIDRFKSVNDEHGHAVGDMALQEVAASLEQHSRDGDLCCRYGGEEFTVLMEGANGDEALVAAERLRKGIEAVRIDGGGGKVIELTVSLGVACFPEIWVASGSDLVPMADAALYESKRRGRNRSLLALGQGRFKNTRGRKLKGKEKTEEIEMPRLFV